LTEHHVRKAQICDRKVDPAVVGHLRRAPLISE
jgi:hypothetical protein